MPHLVDAERLVETFAETDASMPLLVFSLLAVYLDEGPFEFDASRLAERLSEIPMMGHINPEKLAALQPDLERFFAPTALGWVPREGVLHFTSDAREGDATGRLPGQLS
jgi:hypothetical protein